MGQSLDEQPRAEGSPEEPAGTDDPLVGRTLADRYRIDGVLGTGAMGTVYAAEQVAMKRPVAVKVMRPDLMKHERLIRRFQKEAQAASRIESPNVVTLYDFGHDPSGVDFLAMERLEGESLGDRLRRDGSMRPLEAVETAAGIAKALGAAHAAGVVHRDLKPDNVFVTDDGVVKVLDFGIAKIFEEGGPLEDMSTFTGIGAVAGTPLYMSPEAARRQPVGPPADLYALGILLYQMISGSPPFEHDAPIMVMGMHIRSRAQRLSERCPDLALPASLDGLVKALLAKKPDRRPDASECLERLQSCRAQLEEIETGETSVMSRKELPLDRGPKPQKGALDSVQDTVPTDAPVMIDDVLEEVERQKEAKAETGGAREAAPDDGPPDAEPPATRERDRPTQPMPAPRRAAPAGPSRRVVLAAAAGVAGLVIVVVAMVSSGGEGEPAAARVGAAPEEAPAAERETAAGPTSETGRGPEAAPSPIDPLETSPETAPPPSEAGNAPPETPTESAPAADTEAVGPSEPGADPERATLRVTSQPSAEIFLDGAPTGHRTPATLFRVRTGDRRIELATDDGRRAEIPVELIGGETHRVHHDF